MIIWKIYPYPRKFYTEPQKPPRGARYVAPGHSVKILKMCPFLRKFDDTLEHMPFSKDIL